MKNHKPSLSGTKWQQRLLVSAAILSAALTLPAGADGPPSPPILEIASGLPGKQVRLTWLAQPGFRYHIEKSPDLGADSGGGGGGGWSRIAMVEAANINAQWVDPEPTTTRCFYRISAPLPEVFSLSPPVLSSSGGVILIHGQCIPDGSFLTIEIEGLGTFSFPLEFLTSTTWRAVITGAFPSGGHVISASITDASGATVATIDQTITITATGRAEDGPATMPPAGPLSLGASKPVPGIGVIVKKGPFFPSKRLMAGSVSAPDYDDADPDLNCDSVISNVRTRINELEARLQTLGMLSNVSRNPLYVDKGPRGDNPFHKSERIAPAPSGIPGEVSFRVCDLAMPSPAGPQLSWVRTYRSMKPVSSGHGPQWDFSYNIYIEPIPSTAGTSAARLLVHDGGGRADVFIRQTDGTYRCDGMFREGSFTGDVFTLTFADKGTWTFNPLNSSPEAGRISAITDRNGVSLACAYHPGTGNLASVSDAFGRSLSVDWSSAGTHIERVSDSGGRHVDYAQYGPGDPDGAEGDLRSVSNGLYGATVHVYATSAHPADDRLSHNLASITDGAGVLLEAFTYSTETDPAHIDYDTVASHDRHRNGTTGHVTLIKREMMPADMQPFGGYTVFEVDEVGRVTETDFDRLHRAVRCREFTGFAVPGTPVTSTANRPTGKLRSTDPDFYETSCDFNADNRCVRLTAPDGSQARVTYERDLHKDAAVRQRGNARVLTLRAPGGQERVVSCDYLPNYGTPELPVCGNPIGGLTIKGGKNPGGGIGAARGNPIKGLTIKFPNPPQSQGLIWSPRSNFTASGDHDDVDVYASRKVGSDDDEFKSLFQKIDKPIHKSFARIVKEEGGRHTPFHNRMSASVEKERGITINTSHVEYATGKIVGKEQCDDDNGDPDDDGCDLFRKILDYGEAGENSAFMSRMVTAHGQTVTWTHDAHGNCTSVIKSLPSHGILYQYDASGRCTSATVTNGPDSSFRDEFVYNPATGFLSSVIHDKSDSGTGLQLTTTIGRDGYGRVTSVTDPEGAEWLYQYNALDQCVLVQSPPMPARISTNFTYDSGGRLKRCQTTHLRSDGSADSTNPSHGIFFVHDNRGRLTRIAEEDRPVDDASSTNPAALGIENFAVCDVGRDAAGQIVKLSTPAACRAQAADLVCDYQFDERGMLYRCIEGGVGTTDSVTTQCDYDAFGALVRCATLTTTGGPVTSLTYDGFHRLSSCTDPMGNVETYSYDNQGFVTTMVFGEVHDVAGDAGNELLAKYTSRRRVEVLKSNKTGDPNANKVSRPVLKSFFAVGDKPTQSERVSSSSAFFDYFVEDDTVSVERFTPGTADSPPTEVTLVDRSPAGLVQSITRNGDLLYSAQYDSAGRLHLCSNGACSSEFTRDGRDNVTVDCYTIHFRVVGMPDKSFTTTYTRDPLGRVTAITDGGGNTWSSAYDSLGRCVSSSAPGKPPVVFEYDGASTAGAFSVQASCDVAGTGTPVVLGSSFARCGELKSETDSYGHITAFTCDALGRVTRCDNPDGTFETTTYDSRGLVATGTFSDGTTRNLTVDDLGRVVHVSWTAPGGVTATPDAIYHYDGRCRLTYAEQGSSIVQFAYDSVGNPVSETQTGVTTAPQIVTRSFSHRGRTGIVYPDGRAFIEERGPLGELLSISAADASGAPVSPPVVSLEYAGHRVWRGTQANGVVTIHTYRGDGETAPPGAPDASFGACVRTTVTDASSAVISDCITRRAPDQSVITSETYFSSVADAPGRVKQFVRDGLGRVIECVTSTREITGGPMVPESSVSYTLDIEGRRLSETRNGAPGTYSQDSALPPGDQQMGQYTTWPGGPLTWDDAGNLLSMHKGTTSLEFVHDAAGRLVACNQSDTLGGGPPTPVAEFSYDALGRVMIHKIHRGESLPSVDTWFVHDGGTCIQELTDDGTGAINASLTMAGDGGLKYCIATRDGTLYYPGGGSSADRGIQHWGDRKDVCPGGPRNWPQPGYFTRLVTNGTGTPIERFDCDDACKPIFLDHTGAVRPGATASVGPIKWMAPECLWIAETGMFHGPGSVYSPDLGTLVSKEKKKEPANNGEGKKEYVGHVSLMK